MPCCMCTRGVFVHAPCLGAEVPCISCCLCKLDVTCLMSFAPNYPHVVSSDMCAQVPGAEVTVYRIQDPIRGDAHDLFDDGVLDAPQVTLQVGSHQSSINRAS